MSEKNIVIENIYEKKVLLVDDERDVTDLIEEVLRKEGFHNIIKAYNGRGAIDLYRNHNPDVIMCLLIVMATVYIKMGTK